MKERIWPPDPALGETTAHVVLGTFTSLELPFTTEVIGYAYHWISQCHTDLWSAPCGLV